MSAKAPAAARSGSSSGRARVPAAADQYFRVLHHVTEHPVISSAYTPGKEWRHPSRRKPVSLAWCLMLREQGVQAVMLSAGGRDADFQLSELILSSAVPQIRVEIGGGGDG
jgi:hypothetical protein